MANLHVIPAQAGIQKNQRWIPGLRCAPPGMTRFFGLGKCHGARQVLSVGMESL